MDGDDIVLERLRFLRGEVDYLKSERDRVRSFQTYSKNTRLKKAVERSLQVAILKKHLGDFDAYAGAIADYLTRTAGEPEEGAGEAP